MTKGSTKKHEDLKKRVIVDFIEEFPGSKLWPNNTGKAWQSNEIKWDGHGPRRRLSLFNARPVSFGLCKGSSDIIGFKKTRGAQFAIFVAIECKTGKSNLTKIQKRFLEMVSESGGIAFVAKGTEEEYKLELFEK